MIKKDLNELLSPTAPLPPDEIMLSKALEILETSPHGQQLVNFIEKKEIIIKIIPSPQPVAYLPEKKLGYIGFNRNNPISPCRFILMLIGLLREAQQEATGIIHPSLQAPLEEHLNISVAKEEDKVWYMCTIATELETQDSFKDYGFLDELRKMGHNESLELWIEQERK